MDKESSEVLCIVEQNENGEMVYRTMQLVDNNGGNNNYMIMDDDFCLVEYEIASSDESQIVATRESMKNEDKPVEIVFLPNFEDGDNTPIVLKQELDCSSEQYDYIEENVTHSEDSFESNFDCSYKNENPFKDTNIQKVTSTNVICDRPQQRTTFETLLQVATRKVNELSGSQNPNLQEPKEHTLLSHPDIKIRRRNVNGHHQPKLWTHYVDKTIFDKDKKYVNIRTNELNSKSSLKNYSDLNKITIKVKKESIEEDIPTRTNIRNYPFRCRACDQSFRQSSSLIIHSKVHRCICPEDCIIS